MKNKFLKGVIAIAVVALVAGYGISRSVNNRNAALSDLTLANLEALAQNESDGGETGCDTNHYMKDHTLKLVNCIPFFWLQKLKCKPMSGHCCRTEGQRSCSGQNPGVDFGFKK